MDFYIEVEMTRPKIPGQRRRIIGTLMYSLIPDIDQTY